MGLWAYVRDHWASSLLRTGALAFVALTLLAYGTDDAVTAFVCVVLATANAAALALEWARRRGFYRRCRDVVEGLDEKALAPELVGRPGFAEGRLLYDALDVESRDMRDRVAGERRRQREYREYVETWVHEVKTPIAAARLVARNNPSPATDAMDAELSSIEGYVEQALYYSRGASLDRDFLLREVSLAKVAQDAVRSKARTLIDAHVSPELEGLDVTVRTDPKWLAFVLGQLLVNAAKYRKEGEGAAHVRISAERAETGLDAWATVLSVSDDGLGIPASDVGCVFDKGFTGENGRRFARSTGIGLYLVRELCEKMGLTVSLASEQGVGTEVRIAFPDSASRG